MSDCLIAALRNEKMQDRDREESAMFDSLSQDVEASQAPAVSYVFQRALWLVLGEQCSHAGNRTRSLPRFVAARAVVEHMKPVTVTHPLVPGTPSIFVEGVPGTRGCVTVTGIISKWTRERWSRRSDQIYEFPGRGSNVGQNFCDFKIIYNFGYIFAGVGYVVSMTIGQRVGPERVEGLVDQSAGQGSSDERECTEVGRAVKESGKRSASGGRGTGRKGVARRENHSLG
jgi:hypothetical protein